MYRDIPEELRTRIEPVIEDHGLELVDAVLRGGRGRPLLRITVDRPAGDGRVPVERLAALSREVEAVLDGWGALGRSYQLEVSSPGLDRVLGREKDFEAAVGRKVKLETRHAVEGQRRFQGRVLRFDGEQVVLEADGRQVVIPFAEIARARAVYEFSRADFAR